jgi:chromosome segregation ATPase
MPFFRGGLPQNMEGSVFRESSTYIAPQRNYGSGAINDADERLASEVIARRQQLQTRASRTHDHEEVVKEELSSANGELNELRRRRKFLEQELAQNKVEENALVRKKARIVERLENVRKLKKEATEKERKRQAAFKRKLEDAGAKPVGVRKAVQVAKTPVKFAGFRLAKKDGA